MEPNLKIFVFCTLTALFLSLGSCSPITTGSASAGAAPGGFRLDDAVYEDAIRTVRLHPRGSALAPAVAPINDRSLVLSFDDLTADRDTYYARLIHCNYDWTRSSLQDLDFLAEYNEFPINDARFSVDTHYPYVHYTLPMPAVKIPGNYVVAVYRGSNRDEVILTRRFMVFDNRVTFARDQRLVGSGAMAQLNQQINFTINHSNVEILNPMQDVHVCIRQNQRWDNLALNLPPTLVRDIEKELEYRFFDDDQMFRGGNEFRFFDLRSLNSPGRNVDHVDRRQKPFEVFLARDRPRTHEAYSQYDEYNGNFIIDNFDYRDVDYANYAWVNFALQTPPVQGDVYVAGAFNYWNYDATNRMQYDSAASAYRARILLKQGWYDYLYHVKSRELPPYHLEGSHFETENLYEVFVYYRPFQPRADLLIGYMRFVENPR